MNRSAKSIRAMHYHGGAAEHPIRRKIMPELGYAPGCTFWFDAEEGICDDDDPAD